MSEQFDSKISRLAKRYKGLARFVSAANDLYIYGIFESNFPKLMEDINKAKDHCKIVIKDTKEEIETVEDGLTVMEPKTTDPLIQEQELQEREKTDVEDLYKDGM